jgi:hypothetical protein
MLKAVPKHIEEVDVTAKMKQIKQIMSPASQTATQSGKSLKDSHQKVMLEVVSVVSLE